MNYEEISGERQYDFTAAFSYIRESGTMGEKRAAEQLLSVLDGYGISGRTEAFEYEKVCTIQAYLAVEEPYKKEYPVTAMFFDNAINIDSRAPFLYVQNGDEISLAHAAGKIILINEMIKPDKMQRICDSKAAAFISICGTPVDTGNDCVPAERPAMKSQTIPGARIHMKYAAELVERGAESARLVIRQEKRKIQSQNVAARIKGTDYPDEIMTLTAHYDSVPAGPGAYDNMAGCAIIMELCRYFHAHPPKRTLDFVWFGAEEKGLRGSRAYVQAHESELKNHRFNMNVDLAGQLLGGNVIGLTTEQEVCNLIWDIAKKADMGIEILHRIWSSDSNTFAAAGVPAMTLNRDGYGMHTSFDTIDLISPWSLKRSADLLGTIAENFAQADSFPFARSVPKEFMDALNRR